MNDTWYVEYAIANVFNRNQVVNIESFSDIVKKNIGKEIYRSMYLYSEDIVEYLKENKTVVGFDGVQSVDKLVIDIDYAKSPDRDIAGQQTIDDVFKVISIMDELSIREHHYNIWFSGTGFHIHLADVYGFQDQVSKNLAYQVRSTMQRDFENAIDNIYDSRRLIRAGFSYNSKSKTYKVPIDIKMLGNMTYDEVIEYAKDPSGKKPNTIVHESIIGLEPMDVSRKNTNEVRKVFENANASTTRIITCAQHIYNAGQVEKKRHLHLQALVAIWNKKLGLDKQGCLQLARAYMGKMETPLPMEEVNRIVVDQMRREYNHGCNHPTLVPYCDSKCFKYKYKDLDETASIINAKNMIENLTEYYQTDWSERSFDLQNVFPFMNKSHYFTTGQLITIIGDTGLGKTAFVQYLITQIPSMKCLFMSLEVDEETISRRFLQASLGMSKNEIALSCKNKNNEILLEAENSIEHIQLTCKSPDIQELPNYVQDSEAKIVVVDTIDRIPAKYVRNDDLVRQETIANALKDMAMDLDVIVIAIHHISKYSSTRLSEGQKLDVHSGKGNSAIEQKSDQYIAFENPEMVTNPKSMLRTVSSLKARDESMFKIMLNFNYDTFTFSKRK
jgi:replicative DNA helicase|tara:strand:+ start:4689 stop:6533 length:1845 start_codon:yes stop_codon:yes gene_type:complete